MSHGHWLPGAGFSTTLRESRRAVLWSAADAGRAIADHPDDHDRNLRRCLQVLDDFRLAADGLRQGLLDDAPPLTGHQGWDALLAALVEHLAYHCELRIPRWTLAPERILEQWWFPSRHMQAMALAQSPAAFRSRGVFIGEDFFDRA